MALWGGSNGVHLIPDSITLMRKMEIITLHNMILVYLVLLSFLSLFS